MTRPVAVLYQGSLRRPVVTGRGADAGRLRAWLPLLPDFFLPLIATASDYIATLIVSLRRCLS